MKLTSREVSYAKIVRARDQADARRKLRPGTLVLVMPHQQPKSLKFLCPCGCGQTVSVNLRPKSGQAWTLGYDPKRGLSLWPSVWLVSGCGSHFILRYNRAHLVGGKPPLESASRFGRLLGSGRQAGDVRQGPEGWMSVRHQL